MATTLYSYKVIDLAKMEVKDSEGKVLPVLSSEVTHVDKIFADKKIAKQAYLQRNGLEGLTDTEIGFFEAYDASGNSIEVLSSSEAQYNTRIFEDTHDSDQFIHLLFPSSLEQRLGEKEKTPFSTNQKKKVAIVRAMDARNGKILPMDYVYVSENLNIAKSAKAAYSNYVNEGGPKTREELVLKRALEHAVTSCLYHDQPYKITVAVVNASDVYEANNPGEYLYGGNEPIEGYDVIMVHDGRNASSIQVLRSKPKADLEPTV